jgi:predicted nucleic acid-binding protein
MIILDTNVLSELMRPSPSERVVQWIGQHPAGDLATTAMTEAEILFGIALLPAGRRRSDLAQAAGAMFAEDFEGRVLSFDQEAAAVYAVLCANRRAAGRPISTFDAQIAAICVARGLAMATRNVPDFEGCGLNLINPWGHH